MLFCATQIHQVLARALFHLSGEECAVSGPGIENARHGSSRVLLVPRALVQKEPGYPFRLRRKFRFAKRKRGLVPEKRDAVHAGFEEYILPDGDIGAGKPNSGCAS